MEVFILKGVTGAVLVFPASRSSANFLVKTAQARNPTETYYTTPVNTLIE